MLRQRWGHGRVGMRPGKGSKIAEGPAAGLALFGDHYDGRRFFNPHAPDGKRFRVVRRWQRTRGEKSWPERVEDPSLPPPVRAAHPLISATFIGHSTFLLQIGGVCDFTDPIWSERCSPVKSQVRAERGGLESLRLAARCGPAFGVAQSLRPHGFTDVAQGARTLLAVCCDRSCQRPPSCEGRHQIGDRT